MVTSSRPSVLAVWTPRWDSYRRASPLALLSPAFRASDLWGRWWKCPLPYRINKYRYYKIGDESVEHEVRLFSLDLSWCNRQWYLWCKSTYQSTCLTIIINIEFYAWLSFFSALFVRRTGRELDEMSEAWASSQWIVNETKIFILCSEYGISK